LARSTVLVDFFPNTTYAEPERARPLFESAGKPRITSARPSPFTSPAPAASTVPGEALPKTTYAEPENSFPPFPASGAPTITSAIPSPLTSPASATSSPGASFGAAPSMRTFACVSRSTSPRYCGSVDVEAVATASTNMPTHAAAHPAGTPRRPGRPGAPTLTPIIPVPDTPGRRSPVSGRRRQRGCCRSPSRHLIGRSYGRAEDDGKAALPRSSAGASSPGSRGGKSRSSKVVMTRTRALASSRRGDGRS